MLVVVSGGGPLVVGPGMQLQCTGQSPPPMKNDLASHAGGGGCLGQRCPSPCSDGQPSHRHDLGGTWIYMEQTVCVTTQPLLKLLISLPADHPRALGEGAITSLEKPTFPPGLPSLAPAHPPSACSVPSRRLANRACHPREMALKET